MKLEIDTLKNERKLLAVKNNTLMIELNSYKNKRMPDYSRGRSPSPQIRGRSVHRFGGSQPGSRLNSRNASREPSPARSYTNAYTRPGLVNSTRRPRSNLARSRSYERPWLQNSKRSTSVDPYDSPHHNLRSQRFRSEDRIRSYNHQNYRNSRPTSRTSSQTRFNNLARHEQFNHRKFGPQGDRNYSEDAYYDDASSVTSARNSRPVSRNSSRRSSIARFDPTAYVEQKNRKIKMNKIKKRSQIRDQQNANKPPLLYYDNQNPYVREYKGTDYVEKNTSEYKKDRLFNSTIDVDMKSIDKRLNALQAYIQDLE